MERKIYCDQVLHGYANGHQMLASSCELSLDDRKKIDELSDMNGRCAEEDFIEYYSGYPIDEGKRYVIAKTWYAGEMPRPGCVWTHSIIFDVEDFVQMLDLEEFVSLFKRPDENIEYPYTDKIIINTFSHRKWLRYDLRKLKYVAYTLLSTDIAKYVEINDERENFENELLMILNTLPGDILKKITFSTMSYDTRKYNSLEFIYQISIGKCLSRFFKETNNRKICTSINNIKEYPFWVIRYVDLMIQDSLDDLNKYILQYEEEYYDLESINCLIRLYFALFENKRMTLEEYFFAAESIMKKDLANFYQSSVELILNKKFYNDIFENCGIEILEMMDMKKFLLSKLQKQKLEENILKKNSEKLYPILKKYISGQLGKEEKSTVENIIKNLGPADLKNVSHMDENICVVLICMNEKLLLCKDIWKATKKFQRTMLYSCETKMNDRDVEKLLLLILEEDSENIASDVYQVFGNRIGTILYKTLEFDNNISEKNIVFWKEVMLKDQNLLLKNIEKIPYNDLRRQIFLQINVSDYVSYTMITKKEWEKLYQTFIARENDYNLKIKLALQFMPVIITSDYVFENEIIVNTVGIIYKELKSDSLDFDDWNRFQHLLPQVELCYTWDRCLRIRKLFEIKGYSIGLLENTY